VKKKANARRLILGTAQFGMNYGKAVPTVPPSDGEFFAIMDMAWDAGLRAVDTAPVYGNAEDRIGAWIRARRNVPLIISKAPPLANTHSHLSATAVLDGLAASRSALGVDCIDVYLMHRAENLHHPGVVDSLRNAVERGHIGGFGTSVYEVKEFEQTLTVPGVTDIEVPLSLLDRRFAKSSPPEPATAHGIRIWARSVFLQGVLFLRPDELPPYLAALKPTLVELEHLTAAYGTNVSTAALQSVLSDSNVSGAVVGVTSAGQLRDLLRMAAYQAKPDLLEQCRQLASSIPHELTDPRRWPAALRL